MGKDTKIAWTAHTFNPWWGCTKVSAGCKNCYASTSAKRWGYDIWGTDKPRRFFGEKHWTQPIKWNEAAKKAGTRARVFCASMADVFEDRADLIEHRHRLYKLIHDTPMLDWLILTKRPENIIAMQSLNWHYNGIPDNVWIGTTAENQEQADIRIPELLKIPAKVRWLSIEPMLERISTLTNYNAFRHSSKPISWVIVGGESGPGCRPFDWDWARDIRDQCKSAGVPFFMKQGGGHPNKRHELEDIPDDLRIREFPKRRNDNADK